MMKPGDIAYYNEKTILVVLSVDLTRELAGDVGTFCGKHLTNNWVLRHEQELLINWFSPDGNGMWKRTNP